MIIGTRGSELALKQAELFTDTLNKDFEVKIVKTLGDKSKEPLPNLGVGAFVRELDGALLGGEVDVAIHSLKDIPVEMPDGIEIVAIVERGNPRDCLVGLALKGLPACAVVGVSSERRKAELLSMRSDLEVRPLRGNVPTRIRKVDDGEYDAIVVAKCALDRLGISEKASQVFGLDEMVPAAGQGAIAVVTRKGDDFHLSKRGRLYTSCMLEREFIRGLGGCRNPVGAYCHDDGGRLLLTGLVYKGSERVVKEFEGGMESILQQINEWKGRYIS